MNNSEKEIIDIFNTAQNRLVFQSSDLSLESIATMVEDGAIDIAPKYQRRERWNTTKQAALIESFLLNIPVPPIFLAEDEYGKYSVIDGKQRITSIYKFLKGGLELENLDSFIQIDGLCFDQLPSPLKNALRIRPYVRVITLLKQSDPSLKYEVFGRLNTGGDNLLPQEIRNAMFEGQLNDLLIELSENTFFKNQISGNKSDSEYKKSRFYQEMQDVEYVLRFFTLRLYWNNFKYFNNNMQNAMNQFMDENKNNTNGFSENFNNTMEVVQAIWGAKSFKRIDGTNKIILGIYDAQTVAISLLIDEGLKDKLIANAEYISVKFDSTYRKDTIFQESMRQFTSNSSNIEYRISTMMDLMRECL